MHEPLRVLLLVGGLPRRHPTHRLSDGHESSFRSDGPRLGFLGHLWRRAIPAPACGRILATCAAMSVPRLLVYTCGISRDDEGRALPLTSEMLDMARSCDARLIFNVVSTVAAIHDRCGASRGRLETTLFLFATPFSRAFPWSAISFRTTRTSKLLHQRRGASIALGVQRVSS